MSVAIGINLDKYLTRRQSEIFEWICGYIVGNGRPPTFREIGKMFDIKSANGVASHIKALERKGMIRTEANLSRSIQIVAQIDHCCPICGKKL